MTGRDKDMVKDLERVNRTIIPVNLVFPSNYSAEEGGVPAILLEGTISPQDALDALDIVEKLSKR